MRALPLLLLLSATAAAAPDDARYDRWTHTLVSPCCYREPLAEHDSPKADIARQELREMIAAGRTDDEIRDTMVGRYGANVLIVPEGEPALWLFLAPPLFLALATAFAGYYLYRLLTAPKPRLDPNATLYVDARDPG